MSSSLCGVKQYTSKDPVTCSYCVQPDGFEFPIALSGSYRDISNRKESAFSLLNNIYPFDTHNSSSASIETDNLREGLKSIDNPIFEVKMQILYVRYVRVNVQRSTYDRLHSLEDNYTVLHDK